MGDTPWLDRPHVSFSEWMGFRSGCRHRWYLDYAMGMRLNDRSIHLEFGTAMHGAIELLLSPKVESRVSLDEAVVIFRERFRAALSELHDLGFLEYGPWHERKHAGRHPAEIEDSGERILRDLVRLPEIAEGEVVAIEFPLYDDLERTDAPIKFKGFIDIMVRVTDRRGAAVLLIMDFKTCQWGWAVDKKSDDDTCAQPRLYKHFVCKRSDMDPKKARTHFVLLKKKPRPNDTAVELVKVGSSENDLRKTISALQTDITRMRAGPPYEKNRERCFAFGSVCPHYDSEACPGDLGVRKR